MNPHHHDYYEFSDFRFYPHRGIQLERLHDAAKFALSPQQVKLLLLLVTAPVKVVVTYGEIRTEIWPDGESDKDFSHDINTLKSSLAAKLGKDCDEMIETVRRQGYRLKARATYYPAESEPSPGRSGLAGEPTEKTGTGSTPRELETETKAVPAHASFRDHLGHVLFSSCLYALLHVLALWIETAYQIERFRSALWVTSPAVFLWCGVTAYVGLLWAWGRKPGDGRGIFRSALLVFTFSDLILYFALGWILPPETVTAAGFQTLTAPAAYLKNIFWFQTLTILYLLLPWQDIVSREREQRSIISSREVASLAMRPKSSILKLIALAGLLVLALPSSALMSNHLFESLQPRPQMNTFMQLVLWRLIVSGAFGFECLLWYARALRIYEGEERH